MKRGGGLGQGFGKKGGERDDHRGNIYCRFEMGGARRRCREKFKKSREWGLRGKKVERPVR